MMVVVCNAGPLIALGKLNRLELLADIYVELRGVGRTHPSHFCHNRIFPQAPMLLQ